MTLNATGLRMSPKQDQSHMAVGGCGHFLGDRTKGLSYVQPRGTTARGGLVFHHADDHGPSGGVSGIPDQTVPGTLAGEGSQVCWPYGETHHPLETRTKAIELVLGGMQQKQTARRLGVSIGAVHNWVKAYREAAWPRCRPGTGTPRRTARPRPHRVEAGMPGTATTTRRRCAAGSRSWNWRTR